MSKAREWARNGAPAKGRPVWSYANYKAAAMVAGRHRSLNGIAIAKDGYRVVRIDTPAALWLARWILETFAEPGEAPF